jgi:F-type H+-transporting ATPase subunit delta
VINPEIAKRYALGLFLAVLKKDALERVLGDQKTVVALLREHTDFKSFLEVPQITKREKEEFLKKTFSGRLDAVFYHFLLVLLNRHRFEYLLPIADEYEKLVKEHKGIIPVMVTTARPLSRDMARKLEDKLEKKTGKEIEMLLKVNPAIIGGITLIMKNRIIDHSISYYLRQLKEEMSGLRVS